MKAQIKGKFKIFKITIPIALKVNLKAEVENVLEKEPELAHFDK